MSKNSIILGLIILAVVAGAFYVFIKGSFVGDNGPAADPGSPQNDDGAGPGDGQNNGNYVWLTFIDSARGVSFQYPESLLAKYVSAVDWPPQVQVLDEAFSCTEAGSATDRAGKTEQRLVDDRVYCVTAITEGAAGSVYTQHAYAFGKNGKTVLLTFSTRAVQCGNYDQPAMRECEAERQAFDLDSVADRIAQTLTLQ